MLGYFQHRPSVKVGFILTKLGDLAFKGLKISPNIKPIKVVAIASTAVAYVYGSNKMRHVQRVDNGLTSETRSRR